MKLRPDFLIPRSYRLLNEEESTQLVNSRFHGPGAPDDKSKAPSPKLARLFSQTPDLIRLSPVFFDTKHTLAVVLLSNYCGGLCGGERWHTLVKRGNVWLDQDWTRCSTIS